MEDQLTSIQLAELVESKTNPRKYFPEESIKELAESIKQNGVINPLLVREVEFTGKNASSFEIVDGARRFRAAKLAKLDKVPVIVRKITDEQVQVIQLISFLQSEDIHPLDEADSYRKLLISKLYDIPAIAAKIGKSESYIYQRLQLEKLSDLWKKHYWTEAITLGHALLLSRLTEADQEKASKELMYKHWKSKYISSMPSILISSKQVMKSLVETKQWIEDNCYKKLSQAGWNLNDAELVKEAGSCKDCPKRTGFNKTLFNDVKSDDICTDGKCFNKKRNRFYNTNLKELTESGEKFVKITLDTYGNGRTLSTREYKKARPKDKNAIKGIISEGKHKGKVINITAPASAIQSQKKESKKRSETSQDSADVRANEEIKRKELERKLELTNNIRLEIFKQVVQKQKCFSQQDWHGMAEIIVSNEWNGGIYNIFKFAGIKNFPRQGSDETVIKYLCSLKLEDLQKYLVLIKVGDSVELSSYDLQRNTQWPKDDILLKKAKELKIDITAIEKKYEKELSPAVTPEKSIPRKAKKPARKSKAKKS
jgi:ParB family chromosome partitioning protein